ncbi:MAG: type II toxin-antitoxin system RelE/ParE family toxin [SAR324 cluster bacterium]
MRKTDLTNAALVQAVREMEQGLIDANLGGGILKKRVALPGRGKRGSARTLVASQLDDRWFFLFGFEKNERDDITHQELQASRQYASELFKLAPAALEMAVASGELEEIRHENEIERPAGTQAKPDPPGST